MGLGGGAIADQKLNDGDITSWLAEGLTETAGSLGEGAGLGILKQVMSEEAAEALLNDPAEFASNIGQYWDQINLGAGAGMLAGIYFAATTNLPLPMKAALLPIMMTIGGAIQKFALPNGFNRASGASAPALNHDPRLETATRLANGLNRDMDPDALATTGPGNHGIVAVNGIGPHYDPSLDNE